MTSINDLPAEILLRIAGSLDVTERNDLRQLSLSSRALRQATLPYLFYAISPATYRTERKDIQVLSPQILRLVKELRFQIYFDVPNNKDAGQHREEFSSTFGLLPWLSALQIASIDISIDADCSMSPTITVEAASAAIQSISVTRNSPSVDIILHNQTYNEWDDFNLGSALASQLFRALPVGAAQSVKLARFHLGHRLVSPHSASDDSAEALRGKTGSIELTDCIWGPETDSASTAPFHGITKLRVVTDDYEFYHDATANWHSIFKNIQACGDTLRIFEYSSSLPPVHLGIMSSALPFHHEHLTTLKVLDEGLEELFPFVGYLPSLLFLKIDASGARSFKAFVQTMSGIANPFPALRNLTLSVNIIDRWSMADCTRWETLWALSIARTYTIQCTALTVYGDQLSSDHMKNILQTLKTGCNDLASLSLISVAVPASHLQTSLGSPMLLANLRMLSLEARDTYVTSTGIMAASRYMLAILRCLHLPRLAELDLRVFSKRTQYAEDLAILIHTRWFPRLVDLRGAFVTETGYAWTTGFGAGIRGELLQACRNAGVRTECLEWKARKEEHEPSACYLFGWGSYSLHSLA